MVVFRSLDHASATWSRLTLDVSNTERGMHGFVQVQMGGASAAAAAFGGVLPPGITGTNDRSTLLVSNLVPEVREYPFYLSISVDHLIE